MADQGFSGGGCRPATWELFGGNTWENEIIGSRWGGEASTSTLPKPVNHNLKNAKRLCRDDGLCPLQPLVIPFLRGAKMGHFFKARTHSSHLESSFFVRVKLVFYLNLYLLQPAKDNEKLLCSKVVFLCVEQSKNIPKTR